MTVVSLVEYTPIPRYDGVPWHHAKVQESPTPSDTESDWTTLSTVVFPDPDTDPKNPKPRSFTVDGTLDEGWYRVVFADVDENNMLPTEPVHNIPDETLPYQPLVSDVAALLRSRTKDNLGNEVGTFTSVTRPTFEQVAELIEQATRDVTAVTDTDIPPGAYEEVKQAIIVRAAMKVELSFFSDQVNSGRSVYLQLRDEYRDARGTGLLKDAFDAVKREAEEVIIGELPEAVRPRSGFPDADRRLDYGRPL